MDLLAGYGDDEPELDTGDREAAILAAQRVSECSAAPLVNTTGLELQDSRVVSSASLQNFHDPRQKMLYVNPRYDDLHAPVAGPAHPYHKDGQAAGQKNHLQGFVESAHISRSMFMEQLHTFEALGYAAEPSGRGFIGDRAAMQAHGFNSVSTLGPEGTGRVRKRKAFAGAAVAVGDGERESEDAGAGEGPAAGGELVGGEETEALEPGEPEGGGDGGGGPAEDEIFGTTTRNPATTDWLTTRSPWAGKVVIAPTPVDQLPQAQQDYLAFLKERRIAKRGDKGKDEADKAAAGGGGRTAESYAEREELATAGAPPEGTHVDRSFFHGKATHNYAGEPWLVAPKDRPAHSPEQCFIPKKWIHTWSGHSKGVSAIRFFPNSGHLLLSASMDTKIKIWDVHGTGKCMRTYLGHSKACKDISFSADGRKFVSTGYDKVLKIWDTETGQVLNTLSTGKMAHVARFHPTVPHMLLGGMNDKKIVQWDLNSGDQVQEYNEHLSAVNTITFVDDGRRFVTSSDDKTLRVWEFGIPVVIKYIAEPSMHSMPSIARHPAGNYIACQSMDNQIVVYSTKDRFKINGKKRFAGHVNAGYACQVNFSPDGRFVVSGDGEGRCWFWDWKTCKVFRTLKAHDGVCIGVEWNPIETSKVATCGWDGQIKYWD